MRFGAGTVADLTWKQMVDGFSCTECGRCQDVCPAYATGKVLSPKLLIMGVRDQVLRARRGELTPIAGNGVPEEMIWDCVTCGACVEVCPVSIEHVDHIVDLRRQLVMVDSSFPAEAEPMLRDVERVVEPVGQAADRARRVGGRSSACACSSRAIRAPEVLYWVGCAASFDERARLAAESTAKLLQAAGVDFAILGPRESCTGDPARRMGNEYVFQAFARAERGDAGRRRRDEDRRQLPALLQHARERVPRLRRPLRGRPPHRAARRARARGPARAGRGRGLDHVPRLLLPGPPQRRAQRRRASSSPPSARRSR